MDELTFGTALLGAVLGIFNTWHQVSQARVKLRVFATLAFPVGVTDTRTRLCISVTNRSAFPITISQVGFELGNGGNLVVTHPVMIDGGKFPRRLDARESFTVYLAPGDERTAAFHRAVHVFASTSSGETAYGSRKSTRNLQQWAMREAAKQ